MCIEKWAGYLPVTEKLCTNANLEPNASMMCCVSFVLHMDVIVFGCIGSFDVSFSTPILDPCRIRKRKFLSLKKKSHVSVEFS